ncbi:MAG TPA: hypothetical protein VND65_18970 [Candidatus Binatia bacterium]|nr:hypothetical protein [Candidatus Binatia bacterium]
MLNNGAESVIERERQRFEDVEGYLKAAGEASARTRSLIVVLIVASVLTAVGVLNSLPESWMSRRFEQLRSSDSPYLIKYIGQRPLRADYDKQWQEMFIRDRARYDAYQQAKLARAGGAGYVSCKTTPCDPSPEGWFTSAPNWSWYVQRADEEYRKDAELYDRRYHAFLEGTSSALVDNRFFVHVPFFGMTFDVNDLGILAGVGLVSVMLLLWFSCGTELENLRVSFTETQKLKCLAEFYRLAAMRQVLTIPPLPGREIRWFEIWLAKPVYFIPLAVYLWLFIEDLNTNWIGRQLDTLRMKILVGCELLSLAAIIALAIQTFIRSRKIDTTWSYWWPRYIAEQFERTAAGEWLRLANDQLQRRSLQPAELVDILPRQATVYSYADQNKTHTYKSKDGVQLVVDLAADSAILETIRPGSQPETSPPSKPL